MSTLKESSNVTPAYVTTREVSELLRVTPQTVRAMCDRGDIKGVRKVGREWRIPASYLHPSSEAA